MPFIFILLCDRPTDRPPMEFRFHSIFTPTKNDLFVHSFVFLSILVVVSSMIIILFCRLFLLVLLDTLGQSNRGRRRLFSIAGGHPNRGNRSNGGRTNSQYFLGTFLARFFQFGWMGTASKSLHDDLLGGSRPVASDGSKGFLSLLLLLLFAVLAVIAFCGFDFRQFGWFFGSIDSGFNDLPPQFRCRRFVFGLDAMRRHDGHVDLSPCRNKFLALVVSTHFHGGYLCRCP